jgi:group II intron maturase
VLRGWCAYFRQAVSAATFGYLRHYAYWRGFHSADALIALVYLCCTGIVIELPR